MTTLFQRTTDEWRSIGGLDTAEEIAHQPALWRELAAHLGAEKSRIAAFLGDSLRNPQQRVILTGAGSSAYVGEIIADEINAAWPCQVRAISTTSLLTHPALYWKRRDAAGVVRPQRQQPGKHRRRAAGARPGAERTLPQHHLQRGRRTCTARRERQHFNLMMPAASCDRGFAMTSSFTCMLLAALSVLDPDFQPAA
jgi:tagatose-6-phosphate ketose/aldose isomerase